VAELSDQPLIGLSLLDRVQVLALDISTIATSRVSTSSKSRTITGTSCSCAFCAARQRRSPATIW
jgi:hypothetical protein